MKKPWETHFTAAQLKAIQDCRNLKVPRSWDENSYIVIIAKMADLLDRGVVAYRAKPSEDRNPILPKIPKSDA